jgi:hypothetical protein
MPRAFERARVIVFFLLIDTFFGFVWNPFEKWQAAIWRFKKICVIPENVSVLQ